MKKLLKNNLNLILSFTIPILIMLIILFITKIYPFGDYILLSGDGYNQYPGFLNSFFKSISSGSIFYSFKGFLGFNSFANYVYYSLNLTNIFYLLFRNVIDFYTFMIIIKIGLSSLTMCILLNYLKKNKYNFIFSICYGLSAYNLLYYFNYIWFDSIILLPLVVLGIEKIFKENKYLPYFIFLSLSIICNFYIGYMICIFSVIYFIYLSINNKFNKKIVKNYLITSLLAGLITSIFLIPVILELFKGKNELFANYSYFKFDLDFINVFYKLTYGSFINGDIEYGNPNIYASLFIYVGFIMYFFNKNISLKERISSLVIILFFLLSMSFNLLDYFWQMFQMPIFYPVRYGFIFIFFIILLAFKNMINFQKLNYKYLLTIIFLIIILSFIGFYTAGNLKDVINIKTKYVYLIISILFITYYAFIINFELTKKIILCILITELLLNTFVTFRDTKNRKLKSTYDYKYQINQSALNKINYNELERISSYSKTIKNNGLLHNYNEISLFTSIRNKNTINTLDKVFDTTNIDDCNINYNYNNPLTNLFLNIKYYISNEEIDHYNIIDKTNNTLIYENKDTFGIGFITDKKVLDLKIDDKYINNINNLVKIINNDDKNIIKEINPTEKSIECYKYSCIINGQKAYITYEFEATEKSFLTITNKEPDYDEIKYLIEVNDKKTDNNLSSLLINPKDKIKIYIELAEESKDYNYHAYLINYDIYQKLVENVNKNQIEIIDYKSDSNFKIKVNTSTNGLLFTSIAADDNWKIKIDGTLTDNEKIFDGLIGINLNEGEHIIEFKYLPPGFKIGALISSISLFISIIYFKKIKAS